MTVPTLSNWYEVDNAVTHYIAEFQQNPTARAGHLVVDCLISKLRLNELVDALMPPPGNTRRHQPSDTVSDHHFVSSAVWRPTVPTGRHYARTHWKMESESFKLWKNNVYQMAHNFGHSRNGLSNLLLTINLIDFALHSVCDHFDHGL